MYALESLDVIMKIRKKKERLEQLKIWKSTFAYQVMAAHETSHRDQISGYAPPEGEIKIQLAYKIACEMKNNNQNLRFSEEQTVFSKRIIARAIILRGLESDAWDRFSCKERRRRNTQYTITLPEVDSNIGMFSGHWFVGSNQIQSDEMGGGDEYGS